jgi:hypothetical protein
MANNTPFYRMISCPRQTLINRKICSPLTFYGLRLPQGGMLLQIRKIDGGFVLANDGGNALKAAAVPARLLR